MSSSSSSDSTNTQTTSTTNPRTNLQSRSYIHAFQTTIHLSLCAEQQWMQRGKQYTAAVYSWAWRACVRQSSLLEQYRSGAVCIDRSLQVVDLVYRRCVCVCVCVCLCASSAWRPPTARHVGYHSRTQRQIDNDRQADGQKGRQTDRPTDACLSGSK